MATKAINIDTEAVGVVFAGCSMHKVRFIFCFCEPQLFSLLQQFVQCTNEVEGGRMCHVNLLVQHLDFQQCKLNWFQVFASKVCAYRSRALVECVVIAVDGIGPHYYY